MDSTSTAAPSRPAGMARQVISFALLTALAVGLANALAHSSVLSILLQIGLPVSQSISHELWKTAQWGILLGGMLGVAQWVVIRRWLRRFVPGNGGPSGETGRRRDRDAAWWIVVTLIGTLAGALLPIGFALALNPNTVIVTELASFILSAMSGILLGASQWILLRRRAARAGWWIVLSASGNATGSLLIPDCLVTYTYFPGPVICALVLLNGLALGLFQALGLIWLKPLSTEPAAAQRRSRGWPKDRGARLLVVVGLVSFAIGLFAAYSFSINSPSGIRALLDYAALAPPYSLLPVLGLLLIPLSVLVAAARHAWAAVTAGIGTGFALLPFLDFLSNPAWLRFPRAPICWLTAGLLLTVGWIVAGQNRPTGTDASPETPTAEPPTPDTP